VAGVTVNGSIVTSGRLAFPRQGAWVADLDVADPDGIVGAVEIVIDGGLALKGTVVRGGPFVEVTRLRVAPGADGLRRPARKQDYQNTKIGTVLNDLLRAGGERLSSSADSGTLALTLPGYTVFANPVGIEIAALFGDQRAARASWRFLPDGTLWVGPEVWADTELVESADYLEVAEASGLAQADLAVDALFPLPGQTLDGRRVSFTEVTIGDGHTRARVLFEG
jgi:hypothetical protein